MFITLMYIALIIAPGAIAGGIYWIFILTSMLTKNWTHPGSCVQPASLFWVSFGSCMWLTVVAGLLLFMGQGLFILIFSACGILGCLGLFMQIIISYKERKEIATYRKTHPLPKHHLWLQDLLVAVLAFGLSMSIFTGTAPANKLETFRVLLFALFFIICSIVGTWIASDIFRRSEGLQRTLPRGCYHIGILLGFSLLLPIGYIAWLAWKRTLWQLEKPPKRLRRKVRKKIPPQE